MTNPPRPTATWPRTPRVVLAGLAGALAILASCGGADDNPLLPDAAVTSVPDTGAEGGTGATDPDPTGSWEEQAFELVTVATLSEPLSMSVRPGTDELWLAERAGRVRVVDRTIDENARTEQFSLRTTPALDISDDVGTDGEGGLLGLTFSPEGTELYLHYTDPAIDTVVAEYTVDAETGEIDLGRARTLLQVDQPFSNHNGGDIHFGPDGLLYIGLGDGGSGGDPENNGQDPTTLLGSMLRIDPTPSDTEPFSIPDDNPFVDVDSSRDEIWIWGLRNPWRFSFDVETGDLWIADVGQGEIEEINFLANDAGNGRGTNLGWNLVEGDQPYDGADVGDGAELVGPVYTYPHEAGACSVTGGHVYRGDMSPSLDGVYLFADYCLTSIVGLEVQTDGSVEAAEVSLDREVAQVVAFARGPGDEVYVLEQISGRISRLQNADLDLDTDLLTGP